MSVMYLGFSDASGIAAARGGFPSLAGMPDRQTVCIPDNFPCTASYGAVLDFVSASHNSATSPRADDHRVIIGRRSGHASYGMSLGAHPSVLEVAV